MTYKGYVGTVEYSEEDACLFGRIAGIRDIITYEGESVVEIKTAFDSGRIDVYGGDISILSGYLDDTNTILDDRYSPQRNGVGIKKSNTALTKVVNETVEEMQKNGELEKLIQKWDIKR